MRRLFRRLLTACAALSLLLFVAVCVLWGRSYRVVNQWVMTHEREEEANAGVQGKVKMWTDSGGFGFQYSQYRLTQQWLGFEPGVRFDHFSYGSGNSRPLVEQLGFDVGMSEGQAFRRGFAAGTTASLYLRLPEWLLFLTFGILPIRRGIRLWRRRRERQRVTASLCPTCGYDLRATPERCPECGTAVPANEPAL